jgi:hypothetical protein
VAIPVSFPFVDVWHVFAAFARAYGVDLTHVYYYLIGLRILSELSAAVIYSVP